MATKCGIDSNEYRRVHGWLSYNFGTAKRCESPTCSGESKKYQYALIKGKEYSKVRENFMMLCISCHLKYDWDESKRTSMRIWTEERKRKISKSRMGQCNYSEEQKRLLSIKMSGKGNHMYGVSIKGKDHQFYGKHHTEETKRKLSQQRGKVSKEQILEIKQRRKNGEKQNKLAAEFGISVASMSRIINNKRYKLL